MSEYKLRIDSAYWLAPGYACILLSDNWNFDALPPFKLTDPSLKIKRLRRMPPSDLAYFTGYEYTQKQIEFVLDPNRHPQIDFHSDPVSVVGTFNNWGDCQNREEYELDSKAIHSNQALFSKLIETESLAIKANNTPIPFKFLSRAGHWINPLSSAPNLQKDNLGNLNYYLDPSLRGKYAFLFNLENARGMDQPLSISLDQTEFTPIIPGLSFYDLKSSLKLGATIEENHTTTFRIFAPRASKVFVETQNMLDQDPIRYELKLSYDQLTWETQVKTDLSGFLYQFFIEGNNDQVSTDFDGLVPILDPYAKATIGPKGPAIITKESGEVKIEYPFNPPKWQDLSILECHIKDLTVLLPDGDEQSKDPNYYRGGFEEVSNYLHSKDNYLLTLGINAVELLPIQQFDSNCAENYHWGYMTNNYFSPSAWYSDKQSTKDPNQSFKQMIADFHKFGKSVILDVVYNHVGEPPHLARIDKAYYFYLNSDGAFENWSGCGNTLRCESAMTKHLIIESLSYLVTRYDIDGFRFDLAELIGIEVLKEIGQALKALKPSIILIAEPWSFRGEIKREMRLAGFMFWNDEFREFAKSYVMGSSNIDALNYYIQGATAYLSAWPSQSINYIASHDDYAWIDKITENENFQGQYPTENDIKRTHMAIGLTFCAFGTPMITEGIDFLKSKNGSPNTYLRGDLNALNYKAITEQYKTHKYTQDWINFRHSKWGVYLRLEHNQNDRYVKVIRSSKLEHSSAAILFNADLSKGENQILVMLNPHFEDSKIPLGQNLSVDWKLIASIDHFNLEGIKTDLIYKETDQINLPPMSLFLAVRPAWKS